MRIPQNINNKITDVSLKDKKSSYYNNAATDYKGAYHNDSRKAYYKQPHRPANPYDDPDRISRRDQRRKHFSNNYEHDSANSSSNKVSSKDNSSDSKESTRKDSSRESSKDNNCRKPPSRRDSVEDEAPPDTFMGDDSPPPTLLQENIRTNRLPIKTGPHTPDMVDPLGLHTSTSGSNLSVPAKKESRFPSKEEVSANTNKLSVVKDIHLASTSMYL